MFQAVTRGTLKQHEEMLEIAKKLTLLSDVFMTVALGDELACQHVIRILTGNPGLRVLSVKTQYRISKLVSHDAILDVLAEDEDGKLYNLEIQRADTIDHARRTRFYGAMIDSEALEKGKSYKELPEVHIIYISETDLWHGGRTCYQVKKCVEDMTIPYEDGMHVMYVNTEVDDGTAVAKLMQFFKTADPTDMSQGELSKKVKRMKEGEDEAMYDAANEFIELGRKYGLEEGKQEGKQEGKKEGKQDALRIVRMYMNGSDIAAIAKEIGEDEAQVQAMLVEAGVIKK